ncbi:alpha/beta fold hydrolase [Micromonospora sp.]|uniref:alpha/beta fold hydrolase n=1 Tax=unclassified Micromonospora TaxID=2617518 RepID=UPI003B3A1A2A
MSEIGRTLRVPDANLYYQICGSGPVLLILQGGDGDADRAAGLVAQLAEAYTVVTYDRRGLSRSVIDPDDGRPVPVETHADDVHRLLAEVTSEPAVVFGSSIGGLTGLHLATRHPEQVRVLVTHEPPILDLLADDLCRTVNAGLDEAEELHRGAGGLPALLRLGALNGVDFRRLATEPGVTMPPPPDERRTANIEFFLSRDLPAFREYRLDMDDLDAMKTGPTRVVPAAGQDSRGVWGYVAAERLAAHLGVATSEFPGGHAGLTTHPRAFAARLREVLSSFGV